jgi:hypothetical protein
MEITTMKRTKRILLLTALRLFNVVLRLYGWRNSPKPAGFFTVGDRPYWRPITKTQIEAASFAEAIQTCIKEARS